MERIFLNEQTLSDNDIFLKKLFNKHVTSSIISMFGVMASVMANSIIAGRFFGADGLAVMSVTAPFYFIFATIGSLTGVGGSILTSYALGRDDIKTSNETFTLSVILSVFISIVVGLILLIFLQPILYMLGCSETIFETSYIYAEIFVIGGFGITMFYLPYNFFKLTGRLKWQTNLFLGMAAANVILDIICVKVFGMGIEGIAFGTIVSSIGASVWGLKLLLKGDFTFVRGFNFKSAVKLLKLGTPPALSNLLDFLRLAIMNRIIVAAAGSVGLAAFSIFSSLENFSLVILSGLAQATSAFVGVFTKEMDTVSVRRIEIRAHILGMVLISVFTAIIMLFPAEICILFGINDGEQLEVASNAAFIFAFSLLPSVCCYLMFFYYQAAGFTSLANILVLCYSFIFRIVPAYFLTPIYGLSATWASLTIASISPFIIMLMAFPYYFKKGYSGIFLQDLHAEKDGTYISFAIKTTTDEIIENVDKIATFCKHNELTETEIMLVKLSMEEMMMSIKDHCFEESAAETMDVRILIAKKSEDLTLVLRIRNGGKLFNPIDYYQRLKEENPLAMGDALGISMIVKAASEVHYKTTFGINNLTVIIKRKE